MDRCDPAVLNRYLEHHMLERVINRIAMSIVEVEPCCDLTDGNVNKHVKICLSLRH